MHRPVKRIVACQGWELLSQFSPFRYFPHFLLLSKQTLAIEYHVYIWQVSPQLSCGDTCQIWMWFRESNRYFCKIENFAYGEISERSFSNPHPWTTDKINALKRTNSSITQLLGRVCLYCGTIICNNDITFNRPVKNNMFIKYIHVDPEMSLRWRTYKWMI